MHLCLIKHLSLSLSLSFLAGIHLYVALHLMGSLRSSGTTYAVQGDPRPLEGSQERACGVGAGVPDVGTCNYREQPLLS